MRSIFVVILAAATLVAGQNALAFGTTHVLGQNAEHERITRHALGCGLPAGLNSSVCFDSGSLNEIAGKKGTFGGVGAPDNPTRGLMLTRAAHCDGGDYLNTPRYPQSRQSANAALTNCRNWMNQHLDKAVSNAGALVEHGKIDDSQIPTYISCTYNGVKGRAKCNVLEEFGLTLHAAQDFYSHSNWIDKPNSGPISLTNPPGLAKSGPASWLDLRKSVAFPDGLISGCYELPSSKCSGRVTHDVLNKDTGQIDPYGPVTTPRGKIDANFYRAVEAAIIDTRGKWATLRERIIARYGSRTGNLIICAITHFDAAKTCK